MIRKLITRYNGFALWPRIIIGVAVLAIVVGVGVRAAGALKYLIFGNTEAKEARANTVVAEEQGQAARDTGIEAANTVVRTHERYVEVEKIVREGQDAIRDADNGEEMAPGIDAAGADALCRLHDDLCRRQ